MIAEKFRDALLAVMPITVIVTILNYTLTPLDDHVYLRFLIGAFLIFAGLYTFLLGVDIGITQIGNLMGASIAKTNKLWVVVAAALFLGFTITVAEPGLHVLAKQLESVTSGAIRGLAVILAVAAGIAAALSLGFARIVYNVSLKVTLTFLYLIIFALAYFTPNEFIAISFDASGAATGAVTIPFILALAMGVSALKKDSRTGEADSFGMVAMVCAGAIIAVMLMGVVSQTEALTESSAESVPASGALMAPFIEKLPLVAAEVFMALTPIVIIFIIFQNINFKLSRRALRKIAAGLVFSFIGLVLFLLGVYGGFWEVGSLVGKNLAVLENKGFVIGVGFLIGLAAILAEPAVYVLTRQIEDVTSGYVRRSLVLVALSLGVGTAIALSVINILTPEIMPWHFILPGYALALALSYYVPGLFVGIAFDSGAVSSGPMAATFVLAFAHGVAGAAENASILSDGFGTIAMVTLTPIIALQFLGVAFKLKSKKGGRTENAR